MQADTIFATDLLTFGHVVPKSSDHPKCIFEHSGSGDAPSSVPIATPTPHTGSLSLVDEHNSALFVFLPVKFDDLAVSAMVDYGAIYNLLATTLLPKLQDSSSFVPIVPC